MSDTIRSLMDEMVGRSEDARQNINLSLDETRDIFKQIVGMNSDGGASVVNVNSVWRGSLRWSNNRVITSTDTVDHSVSLARFVRGAYSPPAITNKLDNASLRRLVDRVNYRLQFAKENIDAYPLMGPQRYLEPDLFFKSTSELTSDKRSRVGRDLTVPVAGEGLRAAGYLAIEVESRSVFNTENLEAFAEESRGQYSVTIRNPEGTASGWAGVDHNDWNKVRSDELTSIARQKCVDSMNPRALEPGRYTTILEPQAVHDMMKWAIFMLDRNLSESNPGPYHLHADQSKLGVKLLDRRINISSNPIDPDCSYIPFDFKGEPFKKTSWFSNGVLTELAYDRNYAVEKLGLASPQPNPQSYMMSGGTASIDEMIASTRRGLIVTRLSGVRVIDAPSLSMTGVTRDGLWLIENGKITTAVKNFRFNESPLFVFNSVEQLGVPVRVFSPGRPAVVPAIKVSEFNFTSMADAV